MNVALLRGLFITASVLSAVTALADPDDELLAKAQLSLNQKDCPRASNALNQVSPARRDATWTYTVAQAHECAGSLEAAIAAYRSYNDQLRAQSGSESPEVINKIATLSLELDKQREEAERTRLYNIQRAEQERRDAAARAAREAEERAEAARRQAENEARAEEDRRARARESAEAKKSAGRQHLIGALVGTGLYGFLGLVQVVGLLVALVGIPLILAAGSGLIVILVGLGILGVSTGIIFVLTIFSLGPDMGPMFQFLLGWSSFPLSLLVWPLQFIGVLRTIDQLARLPSAISDARTDVPQ